LDLLLLFSLSVVDCIPLPTLVVHVGITMQLAEKKIPSVRFCISVDEGNKRHVFLFLLLL
jgi:hypothetical protein